MAKAAVKKKDEDEAGSVPSDASTKLRKLVITNLGCIGATPVAIDLDEIVVLVGKNNTGKSTILRAYDLVCSVKASLNPEDFPGRNISLVPEIELHTKVISNPPGTCWVGEIGGEPIVRERWRWNGPGVPAIRQGFDFSKGEWSEKVPWGAQSVANTRRPKPHRIEAFGSPEEQTKDVVKLLLTSLHNAVSDLPIEEEDENGEMSKTPYGQLLAGLGDVQKSIIADAQEHIDHAQVKLTELIQDVFKGYKIEFDAKPEEDLAGSLTFFKPGASLRMGPSDGHLSPAEKQGSGARRTLMWAALKYAADKKNEAEGRTNLLLMDEPELCLHPNAIREACNTLYNLPTAHNWQVMVTTHSPAFIDLSRDNTTVVRVERDQGGHIIRGTTVFRPENANLSADEKEELKMLNLCDPNVCEFFFGGRTIIVEGDTEYTAFKFVMEKYPDDPRLKDVHIVRARGKATICLVAKILNQFNARYSILHDSDSPECVVQKKNGDTYKRANPAWTINSNICDSVKSALEAGHSRLIAVIPNFEVAFFGYDVSTEKPFHTWRQLKESDELSERVRLLLYSLLEFDQPVPEECEEWSDPDALTNRWNAYADIA